MASSKVLTFFYVGQMKRDPANDAMNVDLNQAPVGMGMKPLNLSQQFTHMLMYTRAYEKMTLEGGKKRAV